MVNFTDLSRSGGIINAYEAVKLAATIKGDRKLIPVKPTKSTVKPKIKG